MILPDGFLTGPDINVHGPVEGKVVDVWSPSGMFRGKCVGRKFVDGKLVFSFEHGTEPVDITMAPYIRLREAPVDTDAA